MLYEFWRLSVSDCQHVFCGQIDRDRLRSFYASGTFPNIIFSMFMNPRFSIRKLELAMFLMTARIHGYQLEIKQSMLVTGVSCWKSHHNLSKHDF